MPKYRSDRAFYIGRLLVAVSRYSLFKRERFDIVQECATMRNTHKSKWPYADFSRVIYIRDKFTEIHSQEREFFLGLVIRNCE